MAIHIRRREFIFTLGGAAVGWPLSGRAQQLPMPVIGFLRSSSIERSAHLMTAFRQGLKEAGYSEGQNVAIEYRWAQGQLNRLPDLAADLVRRQVAVIVVNNAAARAARGATSVTPIVFVSGADPVRTGLVSNLSRPTDNMTGASYFGGPELVTKRLGLLHECIPEATPIAALLDPNYVEVEAELREAESAARELKRKMLVVKAGNDVDFHASFSSMVQAGVSGVLVGGGGFFNSQRRQLVTLAARHAMFAIYNLREFVEVGGLMSYGGSTADAYRRAGIYVGRIIKGTKPGDLPVELPTKFELIINVATAKGLGLEIRQCCSPARTR